MRLREAEKSSSRILKHIKVLPDENLQELRLLHTAFNIDDAEKGALAAVDQLKEVKCDTRYTGMLRAIVHLPTFDNILTMLDGIFKSALKLTGSKGYLAQAGKLLNTLQNLSAPWQQDHKAALLRLATVVIEECYKGQDKQTITQLLELAIEAESNIVDVMMQQTIALSDKLRQAPYSESQGEVQAIQKTLNDGKNRLLLEEIGHVLQDKPTIGLSDHMKDSLKTTIDSAKSAAFTLKYLEALCKLTALSEKKGKPDSVNDALFCAWTEVSQALNQFSDAHMQMLSPTHDKMRKTYSLESWGLAKYEASAKQFQDSVP